MLSALQEGFMNLFSYQAFSMMIVGTLIGLVLGFIPGIGGYVGLALVLPFILYMDPVSAMACILSMHAVVTTAGSVSSTVLGVPGTGQNIATCFDGYPMTKKGEGARAVGAGLTASMLGGVVGAVVLIAMIPVIRPIVMAIGSSEFFMMVLLGITGVIFMASDLPRKGIIMASLGFMFSMVGQDWITGANRFTFGSPYLQDGLQLNSLVLGQVALSEMVAMAVKGGLIAPTLGKMKLVWGEMFQGVLDVFRHWALFLRSSIIGVIIGIIPGLGGEAAALITYGAAKQSSSKPELFGTGIVEGVIAPEAANNSKEGGVLLPTLAFGVPGSGVMAILLGVFIIMGITPGKSMLTENLALTFSMAWTVALANIIGSLLMFITASYFIRLTRVPIAMLMPVVTTFILIGSYSSTFYIGDLVTSFCASLLGYYAWKKCHYPLAPFILAFVLGELTERSFRLTLQVNGPLFFLRPVSAVLLVGVILLIVIPLWRTSKRKKSAGYAEEKEKATIDGIVLSFVFLLVFAGLLSALGNVSDASSRFFPLMVGIPGLLLMVYQIIRELRMYKQEKRSDLNGETVVVSDGAALKDGSSIYKKELHVWLWLALTILLVWLVSFLVALPISIIYLSRWVFRRKWLEAVILAAALWLIAYFVFNSALNIPVGRGLFVNIY